MNIENLHQKIFQNLDNEKIISYLCLGGTSSKQLEQWPKGYGGPGSDEYFDEYGELVPTTVKYTLNTRNIMVNEISGEIFSAHIERFTFLVKGAYQNRHEGIRIGYTLDACVDVTELGSDWALLTNVSITDEEELEIEKAYIYTQQKINGKP